MLAITYLKQWDSVFLLQKWEVYLKASCSYHLNKVSSRPAIIDFSKIKATRMLFSSIFSKQLTPESLIVNIDEWVLNRNTKTVYSWSQKGVEPEIQNTLINGSVSVILAVFSNGWFYCTIMNHTINGRIFETFWNNLIDWCRTEENIKSKELIAIIDNWPSHRKKTTWSSMRRKDWKVFFLPAYSPVLAPVELIFNRFKMKLKTKFRGKSVKIESMGGQTLIYNTLKEITASQILGAFRTLYAKIRHYLDLIGWLN